MRLVKGIATSTAAVARRKERVKVNKRRIGRECIREKERCLRTARGDEFRSGFSSSGLGCLKVDGIVCIEIRR